ncbi:hypothetical protein Cgig2_001151 [Carnegiea gigantea]|uniref:Uncharacterized protein n=1 Tax=Carnegiea gigantea TaxID=171969 RepID=A0A9Q1QC15_9CARY|nr:hypothetical protein Cgig2_001151 [Carnegiea gigantea]
MLLRQSVKHEWLPVKCRHCRMFGHEESICKKKGIMRQEWRPQGLDEFTLVPSRSSAKHISEQQQHNITKHKIAGNGSCTNSYQLLSAIQEKQQPSKPDIHDPPPSPHGEHSGMEMGSVGLFETKVKPENVDKVATKVFLGWRWQNNFSLNSKVKFDALGLSDHTPLIIQFPTSPKPQLSFKYCDMWSLHKDFMPMVTATIPRTHHIINLKQVKGPETALHHNPLLQSLITKAARKLASYIFTLKEDNENIAEGFEQVGRVMLSYYKNLLGTQPTIRSPIDHNIIQNG